ncbi:MAG: MBOAT family protein [Pseudodesulfovibrio sp.]|nr:MBOAT family protein [Pseudodesulfovibrio sp.]
MIFYSLEFLIFFMAILASFYFLRNNSSRKAVLLAASYYFYAYWDWRFLSLILISTGVDFVVGKRMAITSDVRQRKMLMLVSLIVNLGLLGFFKYFNFFIDSLRPIIEGLGMNAVTLNILLPVGISFYTFQTLSYSIDIYRKKLEPQESLLDFALFVAFFPQLVAGPIVRAAHFLPQLLKYKPLTSANLYMGFQIFIYGMFKKVFIADRLAMFSDHVFANAGAYDCVTTWMAAAAFHTQVYFDFSGYSDMAIGIACILGYDLGTNFNFPFFSKGINEFWQRWHISLSTWVRDYIYFPLGGSKKGRIRGYVNSFLAMVLCGLWHGATWNCVLWGGCHGIGTVANSIWTHSGCGGGNSRFAKVASWIVTTVFIVAVTVILRAQDMDQALLMFRQMFMPEAGQTWLSPFVIFIWLAMVPIHWLEYTGRWEGLFTPVATRWFSPAIIFSLLWLVVIFYPTGFQPFFYFQF